MTFTRSLLKVLFAVVILIALCKNKSYADGFPVRPGRLILSPSTTYFFANSQWDSTGVKKPFADNGKFKSISYSLFAEYGVSRRFAVVAYIPYVLNNFTEGGKSYPSSGFTDLEVGVKYYLANINYIYYFSLQATDITPLYSNRLLGYEEEGAELKLSFSGSGTLFDRNYYFNVDNGVRYYFGNGGPFQDRYNGSFGLTLDGAFKNQLSASIGGFYTTSKFNQDVIYNPTVNKNFAFTQASLTYGHAFTKGFSIFLTGGQFITGRNTGDGTSVAVSFAFRLGN